MKYILNISVAHSRDFKLGKLLPQRPLGFELHAEVVYMLLFRFVPNGVSSRLSFSNMTSARNDFGYCRSLSRVLKDVASERQNAAKRYLYSHE